MVDTGLYGTGVCGKPKFCLDSDIKSEPNPIQTIQKFDIRLFRQKLRAIRKLKVTAISFTCFRFR